MKNDFHTLITNMKALRIFSGSSQEQTSASLHLSRSTYASYESGLRTPDLDTLQKLSALYHVSLSDLVYASMEELIMLQMCCLSTSHFLRLTKAGSWSRSIF